MPLNRRYLKPMLVSSGRLPPNSEKWSYEVKWDGFRALVEVTGAGDVRPG